MDDWVKRRDKAVAEMFHEQTHGENERRIAELEAKITILRKAMQEAIKAHKGDDQKAFDLAMLSLEIASITDEERLRRAGEAWDKMHPPKRALDSSGEGERDAEKE